jgi:cholesterol 7-dehydrogenase
MQTIKKKSFFFVIGEHFVVFRTEKGVASVLDAYCPHLGAHLGIGSRVIGDCVECPFHGWQFRGEDGQCTSIPYAAGKSNVFKQNLHMSQQLNNKVLFLVL